MIMLSSFPLSLLLLTIGAVVVRGYEFDHDVNSDLCRTETSADPAICTSNSTMWFSCPISCAAVYSGPRGTMAEERNDPEQFFELRGRRAASAVGAKSNHGSEISLEGNEGYITMFAVVPMLPGMAEYYYHAIEHIAQVYKYTVVAMILPYGDGSSLGAATLRSILDLRNDDHDDDNDNDSGIVCTGKNRYGCGLLCQMFFRLLFSSIGVRYGTSTSTSNYGKVYLYVEDGVPVSVLSSWQR
mmetsp:Transcript_2393/g.5533  ORF Transcript_2393/g.5533 Transcript_2393/m.5533 type:complete len:242 (-) Transcript_2393:112-837(-)